MTYHQQIDPNEILGVGPEAPLREIREAYRAQAKKHHPDHDGDAWAFRLVSWAYETLSTARVHAQAARESGAPPRPSPFRPPPAASGDRVRTGVQDESADPLSVVEVELFLIRFGMESPFDLMAAAPEDRNLSCCLNVSWPANDIDPLTIPPAAFVRIHDALEAVFAAMPGETRALDSRSTMRESRFSGWLSYPTAIKTDEAFKVLHDALNARRLSVVQTTREVVIPRDRR